MQLGTIEMKLLIDRYLKEYDEVVYEEPWYGEGVLSTLNTIDSLIANEKPALVNHSIAIILDHMIKWKRFTIEKLKENEEYKILNNTNADWNHHLILNSKEEWSALIQTYISTHRELQQLLSTKDDTWLTQTTAGKHYSNDYLIRGIIQHDVYHLAQIRLIHKMIKGVEILLF
jgi:uncharacterized damage-inducible protein DinB